MCPKCIRGLVNGVVCQQCAGTGFWNPESLSVKEVEIMDEQAAISPAPEEGSSVGVETATVEATDTSSTPEVVAEVAAPVEVKVEDQGVQAEPVIIGSAEEQVNG